MSASLTQRLQHNLQELQAAGTRKELRHLTRPMDASTTIEGVGDVLVFCSNNYLGLANHPEVIEAGIEGLRRYGAGTASVRFICGTFDCHRELEERIASFLGTEAAMTYVSCWNANEGLLPSLVQKGDAIISDELNHASIIDASRLARQANRLIYAHSDMDSLAAKLREAADSPVKLVVTDGVFSMEGDIARLPELVQLCREHD
ncbi:MAG: aminotransferase class I/II-fold pyridoxal phosphate-dependent enzyme, partial [Planctomycetaceae bacterium]|nr:aminotransferase class I/II-fold pyridoxal phosphate-dependent enzyme [Planctomycetaceae bacterium]